MYSTAWQSLSFSPPLVGISAAIAIIAIAAYVFKGQKWNKHKRTPLSVNYHFTRRCNYECKFCFHTAKTSHVESTENAKTGIEMLVKAGMKKINFAGGEPFVKPTMLGEMCRFCKEEMKINVSIVSNGSKIREKWMREYGQYVDILAISVDSFDESTNIEIGRGEGEHLKSLHQVADWCVEYGIKFKINTVVNVHNVEEDMSERIAALKPARWKVFQVLIIDGENDGVSAEAKRDARKLQITTEQFNAFLTRHKAQNPVPEGNDAMRTSYLLLDEYMRFLDCSGGSKTPSKSILEVGVEEALKASGFNEDLFHQRGGVYDWSRESAAPPSACGSPSSNVGDIEDLVAGQ